MNNPFAFQVLGCEPSFLTVCQLLGEQRTDGGELKRIFDSELVYLREQVQPTALMRQLPFDACGEAGAYMENECILENAAVQKKSAYQCLAVLLTVGGAGEQYVRDLFLQGEHLRALVADATLSAWLFAMDEAVQDEIQAICDRRNVGVAQRLEAPDDLPMVKQNELCEALNAECLAGVRVTDAHMLVPEKSMCYVLKLCEDSRQFAAGHDCTHCKKTDCRMRIQNKYTSEGSCEGAEQIEIRVTVQSRSERNCEGTEPSQIGKGSREMSEMKAEKNAENSKKMIQILVEDQGKKCLCEAGSVLMDTLREYGVRIDAPCGGGGRCGKCRVRVMSGELPVTAEDTHALSERELAGGVRLACTARPVSDLRIRVMAKEGRKIAAVAQMSDVSGLKAAKTHNGVQNSHISGEMLAGDATGQKDTEKESAKVRISVKQEQPATDKNGFGIGIDIGTTTLAACLYGWSDGKAYATVTAINSGRDFGADVLSRMEASCNGKRARLQELLQEDVRGLITQLLAQTEVQASDVKKIVIAANMTMVHLLMGYSCETLGRAPFVPANKRMICADGMRILGDNRFCCPVIILPAVSAFVGGDIVSGMLALGMVQGKETVLLLDVGTNGEMALRHQGNIYVTSTAAGPAFEGGGISCGCASVPGAVCGVRLVDAKQHQRDALLDKNVYMNEKVADDCDHNWISQAYGGKKWMFRTIGDKAPVGICGSGVLELVSELLRVGLLDKTGLFVDEYLETGFSLGKTAAGNAITFTQGDVRALQLAKGAIRAGIEALLAAAGVKAQKVTRVYLAGGFGVRMDENAAIRIGLLPEAFRGHIRPVGNSSLSGAVFAGREEALAQACEDLLEQCQTVVLAEQPEFEENYLKYMNF